MFKDVATAMLCSMLLLAGVKVQALPGLMDEKSLLDRSWSVEAGLPAVSVTAMTQDKQGYIWLSTANELNYFSDGEFFKVDTGFKKSTGPAEPGTISGFAEMVDGRFFIGVFRSGAPYFQASSIETRYQLQGYEQHWVNVGSRREAFYSNLPAGRYRFKVQVKNAGDDRWSDAAAIEIELTPYWLETLTARLLLLAFLLALFWLVYRLRLASLAKARAQLRRQVAERTQELYQANQKLQKMSMQDALTGLNNRHYLDVNIEAMLARAQRNKQPLAWILLDLDYFKRINDQYGHQLGDTVLKHFAGILQQHCRNNDHLIRWGGEEFLLVLEQGNEVQYYIERLQQLLHSFLWQQKLGVPETITCSIGAMIQPPGWDWQYSLYLADAALYKIKNSGRADYMLLQPGRGAPASLTAADEKTELDELLSRQWLVASRGKQETGCLETTSVC